MVMSTIRLALLSLLALPSIIASTSVTSAANDPRAKSSRSGSAVIPLNSDCVVDLSRHPDWVGPIKPEDCRIALGLCIAMSPYTIQTCSGNSGCGNGEASHYQIMNLSCRPRNIMMHLPCGGSNQSVSTCLMSKRTSTTST